jgi:hypothetical protein
MKKTKIANKRALIVLAVILFIPSYLAISATYNPFELQQKEASITDQAAPSNNPFITPPSFLESLKQSEQNQMKVKFVEALNLLKINKLD